MQRTSRSSDTITKTGRVILIGDGPSRDKILGKEDTIDYDTDTIACVNRARWKWKGHVDFWITLEASFFFNPNSEWNRAHPEDTARKIGKAGIMYGVYEAVHGKKYGQGTSSLFAAEYLLDFQRAPNLHLYGVDLCDDERAHYSRRRSKWKPLIAEHRGKIKDHSYTQWIAQRKYCEERC